MNKENAATLALVALLAISVLLVWIAESNEVPLAEESAEGEGKAIARASEGNFAQTDLLSWDVSARTLVSSQPPLRTEQSPDKWAAYEVTYFYPVSKLLNGLITAAELFRNKSLNPDDVVLSVATREAILELVRIRVPPLVELERMAQEIGSQEFETLIDTGEAKSSSNRDYYENLSKAVKRTLEVERAQQLRLLAAWRSSQGVTVTPAEALPFPGYADMFGFKPYATRKSSDGTFYAAELKDLPRALDMNRALVLAILDVSHQLGRIYLDAEVLSFAEFTKYMASAESILDGYFPDLNLK